MEVRGIEMIGMEKTDLERPIDLGKPFGGDKRDRDACLSYSTEEKKIDLDLDLQTLIVYNHTLLTFLAAGAARCDCFSSRLLFVLRSSIDLVLFL